MNPFCKFFILSLLLVGVLNLAAQAQIQYSEGHGDIGIGYEGPGELELHWHFENDEDDTVLDGVTQIGGVVGELEFEPSEVYVRVPDISFVERPADSALDVVANPGEFLYILPQLEAEADGKPFLGIGTEELDMNDWDGPLTLSIGSVDGPGEFSMWQTDTFGDAVLLVAEADGLPDMFSSTPGGHEHYNWAFTEPGVYDVEITASGVHLQDGVATDTATYRFVVGDNTPVPEPGALALVGLGVGGMALLRLRSSKR